MKKKPSKLLFKDPVDMRRHHPDLDPDQIVEKADVAGLFAAYKYGNVHPKEHCQLLKVNSRCNTPHLHGWIATLRSGSEGLIGKDCARRHFDADERAEWFRLEVNRLTREIEIQEKQSAVEHARQRWTPDKIDLLRSQMETVERKIQAVKNCIPNQTFAVLRNMFKTGNSIVRISVLIPEKDEKGNTNNVWHDRDIGSISGVGICPSFPGRHEYSQLEFAKEALSKPRPSSTSIRDLDRAIQRLNSLDNYPRELESALSDLAKFTKTGNLKLVSVLAGNNYKVKLECAEKLRELFPDKLSEFKSSKDLISKVEKDICQANGNHTWKML